MKATAISPARDTRQHLLEGAARVFARAGIAGSTTREIAREAGVNEVTLFRHFQTKDKLIAAVIGENFGAQAVLALSPAPQPTGNLRGDLTGHARRYEQLLKDNLPLIRTMIGEVHHHGDHERQVFKAILRPLREALISRLQSAQDRRELDPGANTGMLADLLNAMIFTGVLRRAAAHNRIEYQPAAYLDAAVDLVLRGAAPVA